MSNQRLGRGLDELMPDQDENETLSVNRLPVDEIAPNPEQPRNHFDPDKLDELTESIRQQGVVEPIVVRPYPDGDRRYMIVAGERRWRAAQQAGLDRLPGIVRDLEPEHAYLLSLVENIQRENLSALEEARAYQRLIDEEGYSQDEVGEAVGKNRSTIANRLRLLELPEAVRDALEENVISAGHARCLLPLEKNPTETLLDEILKKNLSVRETEKRAKQLKKSEEPSPEPSEPSSSSAERPKHFDRLEADLETKLGAEVKIDSSDKKSGTIIIHFSSPQEFDSLKDRLESIDTS